MLHENMLPVLKIIHANNNLVQKSLWINIIIMHNICLKPRSRACLKLQYALQNNQSPCKILCPWLEKQTLLKKILPPIRYNVLKDKATFFPLSLSFFITFTVHSSVPQNNNYLHLQRSIFKDWLFYSNNKYFSFKLYKYN